MFKVGVLVSGDLGFNTLSKMIDELNLLFVLTNNASKKIIDLCSIYNIPCYVGNPREGKGFKFIKNIEVDVIVSINYLFLIEQDVINHSNLLTFNLHGSLLPKYRGRTPHVWAIINGESSTGITAHRINEGCDTGDIISQIEVPIDENDTGADILIKYEALYCPTILKVINNLSQGTIKYIKQDEKKATYFGKRTPEDGNIDWSWSSVKIHNWVRAQSDPYPGAFTFCVGHKVIIDSLSIDLEGSTNSSLPGTILENDQRIKVATGDGGVFLDSIRPGYHDFKLNTILG